MTSDPASPTIAYGWVNDGVEHLTAAAMSALGVMEAVTCSSGTETRPRKLLSATDVGLVELSVIGEWEGVEVHVTPWREVTGVRIDATASYGKPDPTGVLRIDNPRVELTIVAVSGTTVTTRARQWPFVKEVLRRVAVLEDEIA